MEFSRIHAPISGRTGALSVRAGNLVSAGAGSGGVPLVSINSTDPVLVSFSIPERQLDEIRRFQHQKDMRIEILPDRAGGSVANGRLVFIDNTVTPQTGTVVLKTRVDNKGEALWPGQFVNVRIVLRIEPDAIVVPEAAVQPGQDGPFVYMVNEDLKVRVRPVKVSRQIGNEVVIANGIQKGDQVLIEIPQTLQEGASVRLAGEAARSGAKGKGKAKKGRKKAEGQPGLPEQR
jgi:membrane fusion protein, multidrug efflux system